MDDNDDEEHGQNTPYIGRWTTTSSYDVYMVDTPKEGNDDDEKDPVKEEPPEIPPKHQCPCRRSKSCRGKDNNTGTGENDTTEHDEEQEDPIEPTSK